jgi:hypothetical protein
MRCLRRILVCVFASVMALAALPARAAPTAAEIEALRDGSYRITTQIFMYAILEKAGERRKEALRLISVLDPRVAALNDKELLAEWQAVRSAALADPYVNNEINQQGLYALEDNTTRFAQSLDRRLPHDLDAQHRGLYDLAARMQVMMTIYLRNNADPLGGSNYSGVNRELDPSKMPIEFSAQLDALEKSQPGLAPMIARIRPKWAFLKPRLTDFNQKSVPYLVDLYGRQIIDQLLGGTTGN